MQDVKEALIKGGKGQYSVQAFAKLSQGTDKGLVTLKIKDSGTPSDEAHNWGEHYYQFGKGNIDTAWREFSGSQAIDWQGDLLEASIYLEDEVSVSDLSIDDLSLSKA